MPLKGAASLLRGDARHERRGRVGGQLAVVREHRIAMRRSSGSLGPEVVRGQDGGEARRDDGDAALPHEPVGRREPTRRARRGRARRPGRAPPRRRTQTSLGQPRVALAQGRREALRPPRRPRRARPRRRPRAPVLQDRASATSLLEASPGHGGARVAVTSAKAPVARIGPATRRDDAARRRRRAPPRAARGGRRASPGRAGRRAPWRARPARCARCARTRASRPSLRPWPATAASRSESSGLVETSSRSSLTTSGAAAPSSASELGSVPTSSSAIAQPRARMSATCPSSAAGRAHRARSVTSTATVICDVARQ